MRSSTFFMTTITVIVLGGFLMTSQVMGFEAQVKDHLGSPMIFLDGKPISPLTFYGWAGGGGPTIAQIDTQWREYTITFVSPETTDGQSGIHIRLGADGPGTVWIDDVKLYPGEKVENPTTNMLRNGDMECTLEEFNKDWSNFQANYANVKATWNLDETEKTSGNKSLRVDIENSGTERMHLHFIQMRRSVTEGQTYTYSFWAKADKPRLIDFMALHIETPWTIYSANHSAYEDQVAMSSKAGIRIQSFGIDMPWPKPGETYDFRNTDRNIDMVLRNDPNALLLPRFGATPPQWWLEAHPDDRMLFDDGKYEDVCMASEAWREEMQTHLAALVRHCEAKYGKNMLGYHPCGQHTGEWFYQRSWEYILSDFSPAMDKGFAKFATKKYVSEDALRTAWNDPEATFETIRVPTAEAQKRTDLGQFRDPQTEQKLIDYFEFKQLAMEEPLEMMARVIKQETNNKKLTCFFYGYLFDMHGLPMGPQSSGHLAMQKLLQCKDVDIVCSPISYLDRELGGAGCFMAAVDSVRANGKLWLNEDDTRTYLTMPADGFGRVDTPQGTAWVHERNFGQLWPRRLATWYMDLGGVGWLNGQDIWDNIQRFQEFYQNNIDQPQQWAPEAVVIVDEESPNVTKCSREVNTPLVYEMRSQFYRMGAPFGIYLLSDLVAGKVPPAKTYFMLNCFKLDDTQRAAIKSATQGKTAVWFYGGGFMNQAADDANMQDAIGMKLDRSTPAVGLISPKDITNPLAAGLESDFGRDVLLDPRWNVTATDAQPVARYADNGIAAASRMTADGLRVYVGTVYCPPTLLRNILKVSGAHTWCDTDEVILTDGKFLSITATTAGEKHIKLPGKFRVTDAFDGHEIARDVSELTFNMQLGEVKTFMLE